MGKRGAVLTNSGQTATAVCGGRFFGDSNFFINRKRCPRFTGTVCAEGRLFLFFLLSRERRKKQRRKQRGEGKKGKCCTQTAPVERGRSLRQAFCRRRCSSLHCKPQTAPAFWVPFVLKVVFIFFSPRLFFASFFSPKRKKRKPKTHSGEQGVHGEHQAEAEEQRPGRAVLRAVGVRLGDHLVADDVEHRTAGKGEGEGKNRL